jgi:hypothetical protein
MIRLIIISIIFCLGIKEIYAQNMRFFEFKLNCVSCPWQDTSFIASTNDQTIIDTVLNEMLLPENQRRFINGPLAFGNGGFNHNASHWFLWHHIPNQWNLTDLAMEVCDGRPYSDVDANPNFWIDSIGFFCPWTAFPSREVSQANDLPEEHKFNFQIYPNPAQNRIQVSGNQGFKRIDITNNLGQLCYTQTTYEGIFPINIEFLPNGIYFIRITNSIAETTTRCFIVQRD